jgi:hypothetical protein
MSRETNNQGGGVEKSFTEKLHVCSTPDVDPLLHKPVAGG